MVNIPIESQKYATIGTGGVSPSAATSTGATSTKIDDVLDTITSMLGPDGVASVTS